MSNKVLTEQKQFSKEEVEAALSIAHREYFLQVIALLSHTDQKDLTYVKVPLTTDKGGSYLISILHIDGPKIDLQALDEAAKKVEDGRTEG